MQQWYERFEIPCLGALVGVWTMLALQTAPAWHDTAEFAVVGHLFTTSHSPGHPLYSLLSGGFSWLFPLADIATRAAAFSAFTLLASFYCLAVALKRLDQNTTGKACWLAAAVLAPPILVQGIRPEVYGLHFLLFSIAFYCCARWWLERDARWFLALSLGIGLAGANHNYLAMIPLPVILFLAWRARLSLRTFFLGGAIGLAALFTYAFLPLRSLSSAIGWGAPRTLAETWQMIRAEEWNKNLAPSHLDPVKQVGDLMLAHIEWLGPFGCALWLLSLVFACLYALKNRSWLALTCFGLSLCFFLLRGLIEVDVQNPDLMGYLAPGFVLTILGGILAMRTASQTANKLVIATGFVFLFLMMGQTRLTPAESTAGRYARGLLAEVPPNGTLILSLYSSWFWTWYLQGAEGVRPDVGILFRGRLKAPWHARRLAEHFPKLADGLDVYPVGFLQSRVHWEPGVGFPDHRSGEALKPFGLTWNISARESPSLVSLRFARALKPVRAEDERYAAFIHYENLRYLMSMSIDTKFADIHTEPLTRWAKDDAMVRALLDKAQHETE